MSKAQKNDLEPRIREFLAAHHVMTLATVGRDGPWASAVFYAFTPQDAALRLYFLSAPASRHGANLAQDNRAGITIQHDYADWPQIRGLQIEARIGRVEAAREPAVRALYQQRYPLLGTAGGLPQKLLEALDKVRWYEVVPRRIRLIDNTRGFGHREELDCLPIG